MSMLESVRLLDAMWVPMEVNDINVYPTMYPYCSHSPIIVEDQYTKFVSYGSMANIPIMAGSELWRRKVGTNVRKQLAIFTLRKHVRDKDNNWILVEHSLPVFRIAYSDEVDWDNITLL